MGVEEVVRGHHRLVADDGVEMAKLGQQAIADRHDTFKVKLGYGQLVKAQVVAQQILVPMRLGIAAGLGKRGIGTEHQVDAPAQVPAVSLNVDRPLQVKIGLVQLQGPRAVTECHRAVEAIARHRRIVGTAHIHPAANSQTQVPQPAGGIRAASGQHREKPGRPGPSPWIGMRLPGQTPDRQDREDDGGQADGEDLVLGSKQAGMTGEGSFSVRHALYRPPGRHPFRPD